MELLVVLLLMSLSLALVAPRLGRFLPQNSKDFAQNLTFLLREARLKAASTGKIWLVVIDPEVRKIFLCEGKLSAPKDSLDIPEDIELKAKDPIPKEGKYLIAFFNFGLSSGGELEIISHQTNQHLLIQIAKTQVYIEKIPL